MIFFCILLSALSTPVYDDDLETFDKKFNILEPQANQTGAAKRLKEAEDQINAQNEAFDKGESHFRLVHCTTIRVLSIQSHTRFAPFAKAGFACLG